MEIGSQDWTDRIHAGAQAMGIPLTPDQMHRLTLHAQALIAWNRKVNLTAITRPEDVAVKHILDSLSPLPYLPDPATVLDMGSGGGFPGIPLKIARPSLTVTLLDSVRKKISFLDYVIGILGLEGICAVHGRAEDLCRQNGMKGRFDAVISRALTRLAAFANLSLPFLTPGGFLISMKGAPPEDEIAELRERPVTFDARECIVPFLESRRTLFLIRPCGP